MPSSIDNLDELLSWQAPHSTEIISPGILLPETSMIIFGPAKSWKSILSLHTAFCIASGSDWFGFKTHKSTVFKYQVELPKAVEQKRVAKYVNGSRPSNLFFKTSPYSKIDSSYGKAEIEKFIIEAQRRCPCESMVLILDPIYLMLSGHVSDDYDVKKLLDNLNDLKCKYHLAVILIHHTHKTRVDSSGAIIDLGSEEIMGSSYFNNWADTMLQIKLLNPYAGKNRVELSFGLARHAEAPLPSIEVLWNRLDLRPTVLKRSDLVENEPLSIRNIDKE